MPPRLNLFTSSRNAVSLLRLHSTPTGANTVSSSRARSSLALLNKNVQSQSQGRQVQLQRRAASSSTTGKGKEADKNAEGQGKEASGSIQDPLPDASSEAAEIARIVNKDGEGGSCEKGSPELEKGTPVGEILKNDEEALKHAPKVMRDQISKSGGGGSSRSYSTSARLGQMDQQQQQQSGQVDPSVASVASMLYNPKQSAAAAMEPGYKFEVPNMPWPRTENVKRRYDPLVEQFTKLLMRDGKLSLAQKTMESILDNLRQASPPNTNPNRPLLSAPPSPQLPLNPILYLTLIVDSVAPLLKIRQQKGAAGGGMSLQIPVPLPLRRRRRTAIKWILDASEKRRDSKLSQRVSNELMAVAEGKGAAWEKRAHVHKMGISARTNIKWTQKR